MPTKPRFLPTAFHPVSSTALASLLLAATLGSAAHGLGLGEIQLQSHLGQPLRAEIPLLGATDLSEAEVRVQLGAEEDYRRMAVERNHLHTQFRLEAVERGGQLVAVRLTTHEPIREPYLNFVLNVRWPTGQFAREFTVLIDPPGAPAVMAMAAQPQTAGASLPERAAAVGASAPALAPQSRSRSTPTVAHSDSYLTTRGDSLWSVAKRLHRSDSGATFYQTMNAIVAANPEAFIDGDPGQLMAGMRVRVPSSSALSLARDESPSAAPRAEAPAPTTRLATQDDLDRGMPEQPRARRMPVPGNRGEIQRLQQRIAGINSHVELLHERIATNQARMEHMQSELVVLIDSYQRSMAAEQGAPAPSIAGVEPLLAGLDLPARPSPSVINRADADAMSSMDQAPTSASHNVWWQVLAAAMVLAVVAWFARDRFRWRAVAPAPVDPGIADDRPPSGHGDGVIGSARRRAERAALTNALFAEPIARNGIEARVQPQLTDTPPVAAAGGDEPMIIAGAYIAFGQYREAERILTQAIAQNPNNYELKLALLELYGKTQQAEPFQALLIDIESCDDDAVVAEAVQIRGAFAGR